VTRRAARRSAPVGVTEVAAAAADVAELGPGRLDDAAVAGAADLGTKLRERLGRGDALTVAALAGGTGVGKSALLNRLLGRQVAAEGVRRPTTSVPLAAAAVQDAPTGALLDWLEVPERHEVGDALSEGLVLLDLPDHDSVVVSHRRTAERLAARVDVVVWVLDPVKYTRSDSYDGVLADLTAHADVLLIVLNRTDEVTSPGDLDVLTADLHARLAGTGHAEVTVLPTSAATGAGVDALRRELARIAGARTAAAARLVGDAAVLGERLAGGVEQLPPLAVDATAWVPDLVEAVDGNRAAADAARLARTDALRRARSPIARAVTAPLRGVVGAFRGGPAVVGGAQVPTRAAVTARVEALATRRLGVAAATGRTHAALDAAVVRASDLAAPELLDAVAGAGLAPPRRRWPVALAALRTVAEAVALAGAGWLTALALVAWLQLPPLPTPEAIGAVPWPTALLLGGLVVRVLLGVLTRLLARVGARRHGRRVAARIGRAVRDVAEDRLLTPVRTEVEAQRRLRTAIEVLASAGP
jgi:hypothetical protein